MSHLLANKVGKIKIFLTIFFITNFHTLFASVERNKQVVSFLKEHGLSEELIVSFTAMLPIIELRGAIPIGLLDYFQLNLPIWKVYLFAVVGNMVPIFFILLFFGFVEKIMRKHPVTTNILESIFERTRKKSAVIQKYEELGLIFFVAIPLPVTGGWTGAMAAYLFGLSYWKSILCIFLGVCCAGVIVTVLSLLGWIGAVIACLALALLLLQPVIFSKKKKVRGRNEINK